MTINVSPLISPVEAPPIAEAMTWIRTGEKNRALLNLCQAVPSYPPADELQSEIARLAADPSTSLYTDVYGLTELRTALATHMSLDYAGQITEKQVAITSGCNQAFSAVIMAVAHHGDNVVMPAPYYFNHQMWLSMLGIGIKTIPAFTASENYPSVDAARAQIDDRTRAIVLCSPNNPSGAIYPPRVLNDFFALARAHNIPLIIDETYKDFRSSPEPLHAIFAQPNWDEHFIQLYSFSKAFAMTGYRTGSIIAGATIMAEVGKILDCMTICAPQISQRAVIFALAHLDDWKAEKSAMMAARGSALIQAFARPGLRYELVSSGAYFAYVRHPFRGDTSKSVAIRLAGDHDVLCLPGSMFGTNQEDYLRFAYANADADLMEPLVDRLMESQDRR